MELIKTVNFVVLWLFFICYSYQLLYIPAALLYRPRRRRTEKLNRIAVLIAARNEEAVIGNLLDSIAGQSYPAGFVETFVVADNCTDGTAAVAAAHVGLTSRESDVVMDGGRLHVRWAEDDHVMLSGPAEFVFDGEITL